MGASEAGKQALCGAMNCEPTLAQQDRPVASGPGESEERRPESGTAVQADSRGVRGRSLVGWALTGQLPRSKRMSERESQREDSLVGRTALPRFSRQLLAEAALVQTPSLRRPVYIQRIAWFLAGLALLGYGVRRVVAPQPAGTLLIVVAFSVFAIGLSLLAKRPSTETLSAALLTAISILMVLATGFLAGGLNAPVLVFTPIVGAIAAPLLGVRGAWIATACTIGGLLGLRFLHRIGIERPPLEGGDQRLTATLFFLALAAAIVTAMITIYDRRNQQLRSQLIDHASVDPLTGLINRRYFSVMLDAAWRRSSRSGQAFSLVLFDLDAFKEYNDRHGHLDGDRLLTTIAEVAETCLRREGDVVGRYGGDEFVAILPGTSSDDAVRCAERLRQAVGECFGTDADRRDSVTLSVGVATATQTRAMSAAELLAQADRALYRAKKAGRNGIDSWVQSPTRGLEDRASRNS